MHYEVLVEWKLSEKATLHLFCHVSGGLVFDTASMSDSIFRNHMPMVLEAFWNGDRILLQEHHELANSRVMVHFIAKQKRYDRDEDWDVLEDCQVKKRRTRTLTCCACGLQTSYLNTFTYFPASSVNIKDIS